MLPALRDESPDWRSILLFLIATCGVFAPALLCSLPFALNTQRLQRFAEPLFTRALPPRTQAIARQTRLAAAGPGGCRLLAELTLLSELDPAALAAYYAAPLAAGPAGEPAPLALDFSPAPAGRTRLVVRLATVAPDAHPLRLDARCRGPRAGD